MIRGIRRGYKDPFGVFCIRGSGISTEHKWRDQGELVRCEIKGDINGFRCRDSWKTPSVPGGKIRFTPRYGDIDIGEHGKNVNHKSAIVFTDPHIFILHAYNGKGEVTDLSGVQGSVHHFKTDRR